MRHHQIKILERYHDHILSGQKTFEIRENDRDYQVGDSISFSVIYPTHLGKVVTEPIKQKAEYSITYLTDYEQQDGWVVFGIERVKNLNDIIEEIMK